MREVRNISVVLSAKMDRYKADMALAGRTAVDTANKIETAWDKSNTGAGKAMQSVQRYSSEIDTVGGVMAGFGGVVVGAMGLATRSTMKWESAWTGVLKTVDGTPKQLAAVETGLRDLAKELPATHEEIAGVAEAAGQLGVKTGDIVKFTKTMINMGESTNLTADEAATSLAQFMNIMGTSQKDVDKLGAAIVGLGNNGASTEKDIVEMGMRLAGAGKQAKLSEGDVLGMANAMASVGIEAEAGGTAMSMVMKKMGNAVDDGGASLEGFASVAGMSSGEFRKAWETDAGSAIDSFVVGIGKADKAGENVNGTLSDLGITGIRESDAILRLSASGDILTDSLKMGNDEFAKGNALQEEAAKRYQTAESKLKIASNQIKDTAIDLGGLLAPAVAGAVDVFGDFIEKIGELPDPVLKAGGAIAAIGGGLTLIAGGALLVIPRIAETAAAINTLKTAASTSTGFVGKLGNNLGKIKGIAMGAAAGLGAVAVAAGPLNDWGASAVEASGDTADALQLLSGQISQSKIDAETLNTAFADLVYPTDEVGEFGNAVKEVMDPNGWGIASDVLTDFARVATLGLVDMTSTTEEARARFAQLGEQLGTLHSTDAAAASEGFAQMIQQTDGSKESISNLLDLMPAYKQELTDTANQWGANTDNTTLAKIALGEITGPAGEAANAVDGVGGAAGDAAGNLREMFDGLVALGLANLSEREAMRQYEESIDAVSESIKENGKSLDITSEKGRANQEVLDGIARDGISAADAMIEHGRSQEEVQGQLQRTYDDLVAAGKQFTGSGEKAKKMARDILEIPDGVSVESWMDDAARKEANKTKDAVDNIDKDVQINVHFNVTEPENGIKNMPENLLNPNRNRSKKPGSVGQWDPNLKAAGGIDLMPMAAGGVHNNIAEMVKPNTWRIVGDRMDVDEAFIPLDGSKRSWKIMMEAISRMPGAMPMAAGGIVGRAERRLSEAQRRLDTISSAGTKTTAKDRRRDKAQAEVDRARSELDKAKEAEARRERVAALRSDLRQDVRRGGIRDRVTSGLSGGYSTVDELARLGQNEDLSRGSRSKATSASRKFESDLRKLYGQAERIDAKLDEAKDKAQELDGIKKNVVSSLLGDRQLDVGTFQTMEGGKWQSHSNLGEAASSMKMDVGRMKSFAGKLKKLAEMGIPGEIIQQIAQAGPDEGSNMADSFLDATASERKSYLGAWKDYEKYANQAGQYVTEGFYEGGAEAANGVVKGLEGRKKNVESAIAKLAKAMESTFKQVLGIHSPSRVTAEIGGFTAEGLAVGMLDNLSTVQSAASALGSAAVPSSIPNAMAFDITATPVVEDDQGVAGLAMQDMSSATLEAMSLMQMSVAEGWSSILENTSAAQQGMLLNTQESQYGMLANVQNSNSGMLLNTQETQSGMLLSTREKNLGMLLNTQENQESMRATVALKQSETKSTVASQQEAMRSTMAEKQVAMKDRTSSEFESIKSTTGSKLGTMRKDSDTTMEGLRGDYSGHVGELKKSNKSGFESMLSTSDKNMEGIRSGMDLEMRGARPELGGNLNRMISVFGSFTKSVNDAFGDVGVKLDAPAKLKYASGGVLPGYTPGQDIYRFHNPMVGNLELSGGEGIMRPEFVRSVGGAAGIDRLNKDAINGNLNREFYNFAGGGVLPSWGFAGGGTLTEAAKWWQARNARITEFKAWGQRVGRHSPNSLHYSGRAFDANYGPGGTNSIEQGFFDRMIPPFKQEFPKIRIIWRAPGHFNHAHFDTGRGGDIGNAVGGGGFEMPHPFLDKAKVKPGDNIEASYAKAAEKLYNQIYAKHSKNLPGGIGGDLGKGIMGQVKDGLVKKAKEYGKTAGSGDFSNVADGPIKQMAKQMLEQMGWGDQFGDLNWLLTRESGWRPNAQNPTSTAYGLFQFLNSTWGTVGGHKTSDPKLQLEYGLKYIRQRYGDVKGARAFWNRNHWYEGGTRAAQSGLAVVGENGPELVDLRGSERIHNAQETRKLLAENRTFIPHAPQSAISSEALGKAIAAEVKSGGISATDLANALDGIEMTFRAGEHQFTGAVEAAVGNGYAASRSRLSKSSKKIGAY